MVIRGYLINLWDLMGDGKAEMVSTKRTGQGRHVKFRLIGKGIFSIRTTAITSFLMDCLKFTLF